jgi:methylenetetrahydrofolate reductase (NADPH)
MTKKISDILKQKKRTFSFEFFPPKTKKGKDSLFKTIEGLMKFNPDFFSVTYGAGGAKKELTMNIVDQIQRTFGTPTIHHLTCIGHSVDELKSIIEQMRGKQIRNVLALYGDIPEGIKSKEPSDSLSYCFQLCQLLRSYDDYFSVGVAGFPEGHVDAPNKETDLKYLKIKLDSGGQFVITQFFFSNADYFDYLKRAKELGIQKRIIPGIFPITDYKKLLKISRDCGATVTENVRKVFEPITDKREKTYREGINFALKQCRQLLAQGVGGLHFFTFNKLEPTREILDKLFKTIRD